MSIGEVPGKILTTVRDYLNYLPDKFASSAYKSHSECFSKPTCKVFIVVLLRRAITVTDTCQRVICQLDNTHSFLTWALLLSLPSYWILYVSKVELN